MARREPKEFLPVSDRVSIFLRGKIWQVNYQQDGKQVRASLKTSSKKEAQRKAGEIDRKLTRGENPQATPRVELSSVIEAFLKDARHRESASGTMDMYERWCRRIGQFAADKRVRYVAQVSPLFADDFRDCYAEGRTPVTLYSGMRVLRALTLFAYRRQMCDVDVLANYKVPKPRLQPQPCWTSEEADRIVAAAAPKFRPYLRFLRETGCRANEGRFLTWDNVHFGKDGRPGYIHICAKPGWRPKSGNERKIPLTARLADELRALPRQGQWVFTRQNRRGDWVQICSVGSQKHLKSILTTMGLDGHRHTFRHTYISEALMNGLPEALVREWVGHVDARILKLYTHVAPAISNLYLQLLESRRSGGPGDPTVAAS